MTTRDQARSSRATAWSFPGTDPDSAADLGALLTEEHARAERLLNRIRAAVVGMLTVAAVLYAPSITPALTRVNIGVLVPMMAWTGWQERYHRRGCYRAWLAWVNPAVDVGGITVLMAGYGLVSAPEFAVHSPIFLAYFAVLASRPLTGSARHAAIATAVTASAYAAVVIGFVATGRLRAVASPLATITTAGASVLDESTKVLFLVIVGVIATYATAWNERTLGRALAAQVCRAGEEHELTRRLQEADKLSAVGTIAAAAVHEVRNPLTTIGLEAEMLLRESLAEAPREAVERILADARRATAFVNDLLRVTRSTTEDDTVGPVSLGSVAEAALTAARPLLSDQQVVVDASFDVPDDEEGDFVHGSAPKLERAVLNLIVNSVQAMEGQSGVKRIVLRVTGGPLAGALTLEVIDSGPGFPPGLEDRAFERFYTTKPAGKGTGLGLWIVRETADQFGGSVAASTIPGGGARIALRFPLPAAPPTVSHQAHAASLQLSAIVSAIG